MLINHRFQVGVWLPMKCASNSIHNYLTRDDDWITFLGDYDDYCSTHSNSIPGDCRGYTTWLPMRHPYERVVSLWKHNSRWCGGAGLPAIDFDLWLREFGVREVFGSVSKFYYPYSEAFDINEAELFFKDRGFDYGKFEKLNSHGTDIGFLKREQKIVIQYIHDSDFKVGKYAC